MNIEYTKDLIGNALESDSMTRDIEELSETSLIVRYKDNTFCKVELQPSIVCHIINYHSDASELVNEYISTHSREEFINDIMKLRKESFGLYCTFIIFAKFRELGIISHEMVDLILQDAEKQEKEINHMFERLLNIF